MLIGAGGFGAAAGPVGDIKRAPPESSPRDLEAVDRHNIAQLLIAEPDHIDPLAVRIYQENIRRTRFKTGDIPSSDVLARALDGIAAQVTVIYGDRDAFALDQLDARRRIVRKGQPSANFHIIHGAGHWVNYEAAEKVNRLLLEVLSSC